METWMKICADVLEVYRSEIVLAITAILLILMIITLKTVRKNTKAIHRTEERAKESLMLLAEQMRSERKREQHQEHQADGNMDAASKKQQEEELFGSVLQEIFP